MKILTAIPCLYNSEVCRNSIESVIYESDLLLIDNGAEEDVKYLLNGYVTSHKNCTLIQNAINLYVNKAWCQAIEYFLNSDYDQLVIMNSDLIMKVGWSEYLVDGISCVPTDGSHITDTEVTEGVPGVFIHLNKTMAKLVYPIPSEIKLWYGDTYIYNTLYKYGYKTIIKSGLICEHVHNGSVSCRQLPEFQEVIQKDMEAWKLITLP